MCVTMMKWQTDEDDRNTLLLIGYDPESEEMDALLGRITKQDNGFWHWTSEYSSAGGGADSLAGVKAALIEELLRTLKLLQINLE